MIYEPSDDSFLLAEQIPKILKSIKKNPKVLDMGSGSGIQAKTLIENKIPAENITLIDIDNETIKYLKKYFPKSKVIKSNLFSKISKSKKFDLIIFNPPYLPRDKREPKTSQLATTGGKNGDEIILKFLKQSKVHLNKDGRILLLTSSLTPMNKIEKEFSKFSRVKKLASKKIFFEELYVYLLEQ